MVGLIVLKTFMFSLALCLLLLNIAIMIYASNILTCSGVLPHDSFNFKGCEKKHKGIKWGI